MVGDRAAPALRFFGVPEGTRAIELVDPIARRTIGLVMSDRSRPRRSPATCSRCNCPLTSRR